MMPGLKREEARPPGPMIAMSLSANSPSSKTTPIEFLKANYNSDSACFFFFSPQTGTP